MKLAWRCGLVRGAGDDLDRGGNNQSSLIITESTANAEYPMIQIQKPKCNEQIKDDTANNGMNQQRRRNKTIHGPRPTLRG